LIHGNLDSMKLTDIYKGLRIFLCIFTNGTPGDAPEVLYEFCFRRMARRFIRDLHKAKFMQKYFACYDTVLGEARKHQIL